MSSDEEFECPRDVVENFETDIVNFSCIVFQVQDDDAYTLGFIDPPPPPYAIDFCRAPDLGSYNLCIFQSRY